MDYTKVPRELIYKDRNDLKEFGVQIQESMNYLLFMRLKQQALMGASGAREIALRCYNNAYYVCTLILLEANDFPELRISDYVNKILEIEKDNKNIDEVCLASMAMACLLLARYDSNKYGKDSEVWKAINYRCTHYQWYNSSATGIFHSMLFGDYIFTLPLSTTEFAPRDIVEAIGDVNTSALALGFKYICERLAGITNKQTASLGADLAIARLNDELQEIYKNNGYNPNAQTFTPEMEEIFRYDIDGKNLFFQSVKLREEALEYIIDHHPAKNDVAPQSSEPSTPTKSAPMVEQAEASQQTLANATLQERIKVLNQEITHLQTKVSEAQQESENLKSAKESLETKHQELLHQLEPDEELDNGMKLGIDERVIFISTALGLTLDKGDTNQTQLAKFISIYSGDDWRSIRSRIVNINKELAQERETPGDGLSQGTKDAVKNVKDWLGKVGREIAPATEKIISEIDDIYLNKKE